MKKPHPLLLAVLSAVLLILSFPKADIWILAWVALIPLFYALDKKTPGEAFKLAFTCGFIFFFGTLYWFYNLVQWFSWIAVLGITLFLAYLSLYFGLFGFAYSYFSRRKFPVRMYALPSVWVALEFIRARLFSGFDWVCLGHSQYKVHHLIQIVDIVGVFGISFLIVMVNLVLKKAFSAFVFRKTTGARWTLVMPGIITGITMMVVLGYGVLSFPTPDLPGTPTMDFSVALIQPNIPQEMKWDRSASTSMLEKHIALTEEALEHKPDLIIWPESSCPGFLWEEREYFDQIQSLVRRAKTPLLFGGILKEGARYYNAAFLLSSDGEVSEIYRKVHLVPFGEFIPLRRILPFVSDALGTGDFTRGKKHTLFPAPDRIGLGGKFSVLICFEDTVARFARKFVDKGAWLLVNMTNDAWFGDTKAPVLHLQSAIFRSIENHRGLLRAANTGVSGYVDRWGRIAEPQAGTIDPEQKVTSVSGYTVVEASLRDETSIYTKIGDVFAILCFGCILMGIRDKRKKY